MNYTENEMSEHYKAEMSFIVSRGRNYSDQQAIYAIWRIMEVNRNAKQARRKSLWNHSRKPFRGLSSRRLRIFTKISNGSSRIPTSRLKSGNGTIFPGSAH